MTAELFEADEIHRHRVYGKHRGTVTDNNDTDGLGQIEVTVPTVLGRDVKVWATPCFASGHFFVPPIGAGVWIEFEAGDPSYPIWVGTWYPKGKVPPEAKTPIHDHRVVHTPSGHVVELSDEAGKEKVVMRHKLDSFVSIDDKGSVLVANQKGANLYLNAAKGELSLTSEQGNTVSMTKDGIIVAASSGKTVITVEKDKVTIAGGSKLSLLADSIAISGGAVSIGSGPVQSGMLHPDKMWNAHQFHTHPSAMGPTGPPIPVPPPPLPPAPPTVTYTNIKVG
ncbi:MAG TPA: phage baseplate assembly protein V [Acidimicrobiales bacterium]|jgi:hypothetical protein